MTKAVVLRSAFLIAGLAVISLMFVISAHRQAAIKTKTALGATISFVSAKRVGNNTVRVRLVVRSPKTGKASPAFRIGDVVASAPGFRSQETVADIDADSSGQTKLHYDIIEVPARIDRLAIAQTVYLERTGRIAFAGVSPRLLPLRARLRRARVSILSAGPVTRYDKQKWGTLPDDLRNARLYAVELEMSPSRAYRMFRKVELFKNGSGVRQWGSFERDFPVARVVDSTGRSMITDESGCDWSTNNGVSAAWDKAADTRTSAERLIDYVSRPVEERMIQRRADSAASKIPTHDCYLFLFRISGPPPTKFSFETELKLPPDPKETATVVFEGVPITP